MVRFKKTLSGIISAVLLSASLYSCSTAPTAVPEQALVKLPEKKIVNLKNVSESKIAETKKVSSTELKTELKLIAPSVEPIWRPPVVARVLILPFIDNDNVLHGGQYIFVELKKGGWLFGNYLYRKPKMVIDPLSAVGSAYSNLGRRVHPESVKNSAPLRRSFFTGGRPNLPSPEGQFSFSEREKGPSRGFREQFNRAVSTVKQ